MEEYLIYTRESLKFDGSKITQNGKS